MLQKGIPESIARLINELSKLPGIGEKNAMRLAFHIFRSPREHAENLSRAIIDTKTRVVLCDTCFNFATETSCEFCRDTERDHSIICVVEEPLDQLAIERSGVFIGLYHILHGVISPIEGIGPEDLKIKELLRRLGGNDVSEVIVATNPSVEGEATALYLSRLIKPMGIGVSRIAHGIPMGGDIEYIDELTLSKAIKDRKYI